MAAYMQKKMQKELPAVGTSPELQQEVQEAKRSEWETVCGKQAVRIWTGPKAQEIRRKHSDRFIGSRFVVTRKEDEEGSRIKARICLQGHLDPDSHKKIESGDCHSPTLSQLGRSLMLQLLVSHHWTMNLGDIKGAFLEAWPLPERYRPLYMHMPQGGIPDVPQDAVVEVVGNLYGANDAPAQWYQAFDKAARDVGFQRSAFDNCLYYLRDSNNYLKGVLGAHVDDTMCGGEGPEYKLAIEQLRARFPYRKWRVGSGEFCGVQYTQCPESFEITSHQSDYARHLRPIALSKDRRQSKQQEACPKEITALRAIAGAANCLSLVRTWRCRPALHSRCFPSPLFLTLCTLTNLCSVRSSMPLSPSLSATFPFLLLPLLSTLMPGLPMPPNTVLRPVNFGIRKFLFG